MGVLPLADPETNPVMSVLKTKKDPRHFSEKFMFLINRGGMVYNYVALRTKVSLRVSCESWTTRCEISLSLFQNRLCPV